MVITGGVYASIDGGKEFPLARDGRSSDFCCARSREVLADGLHTLTVRAEAKGRTTSDTITFVASRDRVYEPPPRIGDGSDRDAVGAWPDKHILGTQLGPNRNGRKW